MQINLKNLFSKIFAIQIFSKAIMVFALKCAKRSADIFQTNFKALISIHKYIAFEKSFVLFLRKIMHLFHVLKYWRV